MSAGVRALGKILKRVAEGPVSTAAVAIETGVPRASAFEIVGTLIEAGLLRKEAGLLHPGEMAIRLGFAAHGIAELHGSAEALLGMLRDETDGTARLAANGTELLVYAARWDNGEAPAQFFAAAGPATLSLALRPEAGRGERALAQAAFERIGSVLQSCLVACSNRKSASDFS